jgi:ribosomal protein S27AE
MNDFMKDRYGVDELTGVLGALGLLLALIGTIAKFDPLTWFALASILLALARAFSKNEAARRKENESFLSVASRIPVVGDYVNRMRSSRPASRGAGASGRASGTKPSTADFDRAKRTAKKMWTERKTSHFLKCPNCGQILSVPKGKGKIRVTCPRCHAKMETKS